ncbi:MAG: GNAT family N-acetyltransferase [Clostridia bacterium]|nr:GNAT family N-acetyltransferase [Clostridia bacterium]
MKRNKYLIKRAGIEDAKAIAGLAIQMWTEHDMEDISEEFRRLLMNNEAVCFIKFVDDKPIAFAQCQLRHDYVEGTRTSPVGYLEGIFVSDEYRKHGYAAELLSECEKWAKEKGCTEFASDCEFGNTDSIRFHMSLGFEETNRIVCFRKEI